MDIEKIVEGPCRVLDLLPERVPEEGGKRFARLEKYWLSGARVTDLRRRQADIILKLNCFCPVRLSSDFGRTFTDDPAPYLTEKLILGCVGVKSLYIALVEQECLITLDGYDIYMTVYGGDAALLELLQRLAAAEGLFLR